ncbi:Uncharacterized protein GBIM_09199, partial [Gryllus bimaculatus]
MPLGCGHARVIGVWRVQVPAGSERGQWALRVEGLQRAAGAGPAFVYEAPLHFAPDFLAILVQTTRPVYAGGQVVRFRVVLLTDEVKPYEEAVDVFVVDPDGLIMRRWVSMYNNNGVISHRFRLPRMPKDGEWRIRVRAHGQLQEQPLRVETYFRPLFEVHVHAPAYLPVSTGDLLATACARSDLQRAARGNVSFALGARRRRPPPGHAQPARPPPTPPLVPVWEHSAFLKANGCYTVSVPLELVTSALASAPEGGRAGGASLEDVELRLDAAVTDSFFGETARGFTHTRLVGAAVRMRFLGTRPLVFSPGAVFEGHVECRNTSFYSLRTTELMYHPEDDVEDNEVVVDGEEGLRPEGDDVDDALNTRAAAERFRRDGVFRFRFQ